MPTSTYFTGPIGKRMSDDLHLAGVAERTRKGYLRAVRQLAEHAKCSPDKIDEEQLRQVVAAPESRQIGADGCTSPQTSNRI